MTSKIIYNIFKIKLFLTIAKSELKNIFSIFNNELDEITFI